jgi:hypothetical protein
MIFRLVFSPEKHLILIKKNPEIFNLPNCGELLEIRKLKEHIKYGINSDRIAYV